MDLLISTLSGAMASVWRASWQGSVLIAGVLLAQWLAGSRLSPRWSHGLWLLVVIRLALPWSVESSFSVFNWIQPSRFAPPAAPASPALPAAAGPSDAAARLEAKAPPDPGRADVFVTPTRAPAPVYVPRGTGVVRVRAGRDGFMLSPEHPAAEWGHAAAPGRSAWTRWMAWGWLAGALALMSYIGLEAWRMRRRITTHRAVTDSAVLELLEDCRQLMRLRVPLALVETRLVDSPMLFGFVRPRLLLPEGLLANFSQAELRFIFLHEMAHVRRGDIALSWLMTVLLAMHWFNPLVWLCFARMRADREIACDALVLSYTGARTNRSYGETVLRVVQGFCRSRPLPALAGIVEDPAQLKVRLGHIGGFGRRTPSVALAATLVLLLAAGALTDARNSRPWPPGLLVPLGALTTRAENGFNLRRALERGEVALSPDADGTSAPGPDWVRVGEMDGLAADQWIGRAQVGAPLPRMSHTTVWTGRDAMVWGGGATDYFFNDGGRFDPAANLWRPISPCPELAGRWWHGAVWTGHEMLVWGGRAAFVAANFFQDGARYDPAADSWKPINLEGAPSPRSHPATIWTGRRMFVWSGETVGYGNPADGALYDPQADTWSPIAPSGLNGRQGTAIVWTGREVILWGGGSDAGGGKAFGDGARYDPVTDRWTPLPVAGAPRARRCHTAVWTGREMIIWGGVDERHVVLNSGARFDPASNTWKPLSLLHAPEPRYMHLAVWTGSEMVVWGGSPSHRSMLDSGGRYDPATGQWLPTSLRDAPSPRCLTRPEMAVWAGTGLFFFGGYNGKIEFGSTSFWWPSQPVPLFAPASLLP